MFKITQSIVTSIESFTVQTSDGIQTPLNPGYLMMTSGSDATVLTYNDRVAVGVNTNSTPGDILDEVITDSVFLNASATGTLTISDIDGGISRTSDLASGNYTCETRTLRGSGTGATIRIQAVQTAGIVTIVSLIPLDHGTGYALGDQLEVTAVDGAGVTLTFKYTPTLGTGSFVRGYATGSNTTSYTGISAIAQTGGGSDGVATVGGSVVAATTNGPKFFKIATVDYTTAGKQYMLSDVVSLTCGSGSNEFTVRVFLGPRSLNLYVTVEMSVGTMLPYQITKFRNLEASDRGFVIVS